jgi:hypothetical protein
MRRDDAAHYSVGRRGRIGDCFIEPSAVPEQCCDEISLWREQYKRAQTLVVFEVMHITAQIWTSG